MPMIPFSKSTSPWRSIPGHLLLIKSLSAPSRRYYSTQKSPSTQKLTHLTPQGTAHMVPISSKSITSRTAIAVCSIYFSNPTAIPLIRSNQLKKGDVLGVARIAGIMAAKRTSDLIPLCHPVAVTHVGVELDVAELRTEGEKGKSQKRQNAPWQGTGQGDAYPFHTPTSASSHTGAESPGLHDGLEFGRIDITATVSCDGKTGVEMEALTAASTAALTIYDMCKAVDKGMRIEGQRVVRKEGGKSGLWVEGLKESDHHK